MLTVSVTTAGCSKHVYPSNRPLASRLVAGDDVGRGYRAVGPVHACVLSDRLRGRTVQSRARCPIIRNGLAALVLA